MEGSVVELSELRNGTNGNGTSDSDRDESLAQAEVAILSIMFGVTVLGNMAVLLALSARPMKKLSRMNYFILHLSIADLCTAFLSVLPQLAWDVTYRFHGGPFLCKLVKYGQTLGPYLSAYILMATALDRYQAVCHPLAYCSWTSRRSRAMVWTAWTFALLLCIPQVSSPIQDGKFETVQYRRTNRGVGGGNNIEN
jgi:7 transmembrane receptor (rhodopsin family).